MTDCSFGLTQDWGVESGVGGGKMSTGKHYFIERTGDGYAVRARGSERASAIEDTQRDAIARAKEFNPNDRPDVSRVEHTKGGKPDHWRSARR
jgi:uncharacterized protein YdaT